VVAGERKRGVKTYQDYLDEACLCLLLTKKTMREEAKSKGKDQTERYEALEEEVARLAKDAQKLSIALDSSPI
jgi:hypothetical protein